MLLCVRVRTSTVCTCTIRRICASGFRFWMDVDQRRFTRWSRTDVDHFSSFFVSHEFWLKISEKWFRSFEKWFRYSSKPLFTGSSSKSGFDFHVSLHQDSVCGLRQETIRHQNHFSISSTSTCSFEITLNQPQPCHFSAMTCV